MTEAAILVVEDNEVLRRALQMLLEADGYQVLLAQDGVEALDCLASNLPDLIISDIVMPRMDGFQLLQAVRQRLDWLTIPFIFLTAYGEREDVKAARDLGAEDYLTKPVKPADLLNTVRSRLARSRQLLLAQLEQAHEASLIMLSNAIELRDHYTRGHVERVLRYSAAIAARLNCSPAVLRVLQLGAVLHDIGKIHISESILQKPGPLTEAEWAEIRQHPVIGAELVKNISYLAPAIPVILHHHERWDGLGYPGGLMGEEIPEAARIVAVADSLDAMTSARGYQIVYSPEKASEEIFQRSGSQYDPQVVRAFSAAWPQIHHQMSSSCYDYDLPIWDGGRVSSNTSFTRQ